MSLTIRPALPRDLDTLTALLLADAEVRRVQDPGFWPLAPAAGDRISTTIGAAMAATAPPFRQQWLLAEAEGRAVGVAHSILLPVPPIYAGEFGPPGLIMEDCHVTPAAPAGTREALLAAAEADLIDAGAIILLASTIVGGDWEAVFAAQGYAPLTAYYAKSGLAGAAPAGARPATEADVPGIVTLSAEHRHVLNRLAPRFWKPHAEADARFGAWMRRSLTLSDRDMLVDGADTRLAGYAISQPATPLHFPTPHDISGIGVIDDFFHQAIADPLRLGPDRDEAAALFTAAEAARARRGDHAVLVVCPAAWPSKREFLQSLGYRNALTWHIRLRD